MLHALAVNPDRRHQLEMLGYVDAVDLHHHDVEGSEIRGSFMRAADKATKCREAADFDTRPPRAP